MTFMTDIRSGIVRTVEHDELELVAHQWQHIMEAECDNFEQGTRELSPLEPFFVVDGVVVDLFRCKVVA